MNKVINRRLFFKFGAISLASIPLLKISKSWATELAADACPTTIPESIAKKVVAPESKKGVKLGYVTDSLSLVENDTYKFNKKFKAAPSGSACGNCKFYKAKVKEGVLTGETGGYSKCSMLGNKYVTRCGWCKSYKKDKKKIAVYQNVLKKS